MSHLHQHRKRARTRRRSRNNGTVYPQRSYGSESAPNGESPQSMWMGSGFDRVRHFVWRPVREFSRESRRIFEHDYRSPCPVHKRPASVTTSSCHTALNEDVITVDPENGPAQHPVHKSLSRHSKHSKKSKHSKGRNSLEYKTFEDGVLSEIQYTHHSRAKSKSSGSLKRSPSTRTYSTGISLDTVEVEGYDYSARIVSLFYFLKNFVDKYPRLGFFVGCLLFAYFFMSQLDSTLALIFESLIRFAYPASHYVAVTNEQFFARLSRMASRSDEVMEAFYCDFARKWCERFELMCDVHCSFVEQTLQRIRKQP